MKLRFEFTNSKTKKRCRKKCMLEWQCFRFTGQFSLKSNRLLTVDISMYKRAKWTSTCMWMNTPEATERKGGKNEATSRALLCIRFNEAYICILNTTSIDKCFKFHCIHISLFRRFAFQPIFFALSSNFILFASFHLQFRQIEFHVAIETILSMKCLQVKVSPISLLFSSVN